MPLNHPPLTQAAMPSWQRGGRCFCWHGDGPLLERRGGLPPTPGQDGAAADATLGDIASLRRTATGVLSLKNVSVGRFLDLKKIRVQAEFAAALFGGPRLRTGPASFAQPVHEVTSNPNFIDKAIESNFWRTVNLDDPWASVSALSQLVSAAGKFYSR